MEISMKSQFANVYGKCSYLSISGSRSHILLLLNQVVSTSTSVDWGKYVSQLLNTFHKHNDIYGSYFCQSWYEKYDTNINDF